MPSNLNYNSNVGFLLGMCLIFQIVSGILLSLHYCSSIEEAFYSVVRITRNVNSGWILRCRHINGASLFFMLIFYHMGKNILIYSFKLKTTWNVGILILLILMGTAFIGYVLPWGQISFWAATVITNLLSAIPIWGLLVVTWIWGRFSVDSPTLTRFFSFHFLFPFVLVFLVLVHIISLHTSGSSRSIRVKSDNDKRNFHPLFFSKDLLGMAVVFYVFFLVILVFPFSSADPENFIPANPVVTPIHIQPEWYFLFAYAILRSIPNKLGGVLALLMRILIFSVKSLFTWEKNNFKFKKAILLKLNLLIFCFFILSWIGIKQVEYPFDSIGILFAILYFCVIVAL